MSGYATEDGIRPSSLPSEIPGDGNVFTSVEDLIAWTRALDGEAILSREAKHTLWTNGELDDGSPIEADEEGYGCGWTVAPDGSGVWHSGSWMGTATFIGRRHRDGLWVIVLSNDEDADVQGIAHSLVEHRTRASPYATAGAPPPRSRPGTPPGRTASRPRASARRASCRSCGRGDPALSVEKIVSPVPQTIRVGTVHSPQRRLDARRANCVPAPMA